MKKTVLLILCLGCLSAVSTSRAIDLKQSKITQVVNDVHIISATDQSEKTATVNDVFTMPDILRTGPSSRAELVAQDETVTRVGANTIFSFDPASRTIDLKQGSLLFHSPHGKGGGTIHTGSATASVLGTTLIVTTTPSGGMKVLDLEGQVEVNFLNGLHQNLAAGQMTFVLPGGSQLAPIIIYRLDDVTKNSLLVKGFNQQLASMPLIQAQIDKQLNLIKNGHYTDTGLLVGDDANGSQVQVVDISTLKSALDNVAFNSSSVNKALNTDATIDQSSLTSQSIPTPPTRIFLNEQFILPNNTFFTGQPFEGFAGRNIFFNTPGTEAPALSVDMSPYANLEEFDMVASKNMQFEGSVNFDGFSPENSIYFFLVAGNQFLISPGVTINANVANLVMSSAGAFTLNNATIANNNGNMAMQFGGDVNLENGAAINTVGDLHIVTTGNFNMSDSSVNANTVEFEAPVSPAGLTVDSSTIVCFQHGLFTAAKDININNSVINSDAGSGMVTFTSTGGSVNLNNNYIGAYYLTVNSGDGILLSGNGQSYASIGGTASFTAPNLVAINDADLSGFAQGRIAADTINLQNVKFSGTWNLDSLYGVWHNGSSVFGDVNNLGGNTYNGTLITATEGFSGTIAGTGITIGTK
jgi:hypothetical protein